MSKKKKAKRLIEQHLADYADWLGERTPEELERMRVVANYFKPSFRVTFAASGVGDSAAPGSEGTQQGQEPARKR